MRNGLEKKQDTSAFDRVGSEGYSLESFYDRLCELCRAHLARSGSEGPGFEEDVTQLAIVAAREAQILVPSSWTWSEIESEAGSLLHSVNVRFVESDPIRGPMDEEQIRKKIEIACNSFLKSDSYLLEVRVSERSMCHKLAEHLQRQFHFWHVDCEYNRNLDEIKKLRSDSFSKDRSVFPDIIVHERGTNHNLLVIEAKCSDSSVHEINSDMEKLRTYESSLGYKYHCFLTFPVGNERKAIEFVLKSKNSAN